MDFIRESLAADWAAFLAFAPRIVYGVVVLAIFLLAGRLAGRMTGRFLHKSMGFAKNERFLQKTLTWGIGTIGVLLALGVMGFEGIATSVLATGGVVAIVLGFAFREIGENLLAGFFLTFSRPFEIGDLVKTSDLTGVVRSVDLRCVHIRTFDACDVYVPNAQIFREPLHNYTRDGLRRPSFTVGVAYDDEPERVLSVLEAAIRTVPDVLADPAPFVTVKAFAASVVEYEIFFWLDVTTSKRGYVGTDNDVKISCWRALRDAQMTFSTNVTTALEVHSVPDLTVHLPGQA